MHICYVWFSDNVLVLLNNKAGNYKKNARQNIPDMKQTFTWKRLHYKRSEYKCYSTTMYVICIIKRQTLLVFWTSKSGQWVWYTHKIHIKHKPRFTMTALHCYI